MKGLGRFRFAFCAAAAVCCLWAATAQASFGLRSFDVQVAAGPAASVTSTTTSVEGGAYTQAGGHPYAVITHIEWNNHPDPTTDPAYEGLPTPDGDLKDTEAYLPPGFVGNPSALPTCTTAQLQGTSENVLSSPTECPVDAQVGVVHLQLNLLASENYAKTTFTFPLYNLTPTQGEPARFGFQVFGVIIIFNTMLRHDGDRYFIAVGPRNAPQALRIYGSDVTFWGTPPDERHFLQRCNFAGFGFEGTTTDSGCPLEQEEGGAVNGEPPQHAGIAPVPFLTMPTSCTAAGVGERWKIRSDSWESPGAFSEAQVANHLPPYAPWGSAGPQEGMKGCGAVPFSPSFDAPLSQQQAASSSGLSIHLKFSQEGLLNPDGLAQSHLKKAVVTLPEGMTVNPSQAEGLGVCGPSEYAAVAIAEEGCPSTAKIGTVQVKTPLIEETVPGNVYIAKPYDNPFDSLLALYIVLREPQRGVAIKLAGEVKADPTTGRIVTTFDDLPQLPFESFDFKFREGPRAPLITPRTCGTYETEADFYPWARPDDPVHNVSTFQITSGPGGAACPSAGVPPFSPGFTAGTLSNAGGSYSPFLMRLTRADGEQDLTKFNAVLPPGVSAKIAGVQKCPDEAIAFARTKSGREEQAFPSCPGQAEVGNVITAAGVGSTLVYVPGKIYLAGPYNGAPLSVVAIVPAVAGPFDVGTVVVRQALNLDPRTAEVHVDGEASDPIPHILAGIPLSVREIRVNVDRPEFTINPTSCDPSQVGATIFGSYLDPLDPADDVPVSLASRFQAASCQSLDFGPRLRFRLTGDTGISGFPALRAELRPRAGDANLARIGVLLPHSEFIAQNHLADVCTRVEYAEDGGAGAGCPKRSIYGHARAWTPLLDEPLEGNVYLRSNGGERLLPDLVVSLRGLVDVELEGHIRSRDARIGTTFAAPDAPVTRFVLTMRGGSKGLLENSTDLCFGKHRARVEMDAQNGKVHDFRPVVKAKCGGQRKPARHRRPR